MKMDNKKIDELLTRGVAEVIDRSHLKARLLSGERLRIKLGIDPTSPHLHLGRAIPLLKLRDFQELGHQIVFIVGNFTGTIGDTSDKDAERPMLAQSIVSENMKSYVEQAGKIIDIDDTEIVYNADWLTPLTFADIGSMADHFSLHEFISRENIKKRLDAKTRVSLRELLYPLMQGYDSVAVRADCELGGTDQRFNLLAGRTLQPSYGQQPQDILMNNLILGTDGRKMSSSWGNTINITDTAREMYGKIMSIPDSLINIYFEHCTRVSSEELVSLVSEWEHNPMSAKRKLAYEIVRMYHSANSANVEAEWFDTTFSKKTVPNDIPEITLEPRNYTAFEIVKTFYIDKKSNSEIRRLFDASAVSLNEQKISDYEFAVTPHLGDIWHIGKRTWFRVITPQ